MLEGLGGVRRLGHEAERGDEVREGELAMELPRLQRPPGEVAKA
jgi:hypothetical protein